MDAPTRAHASSRRLRAIKRRVWELESVGGALGEQTIAKLRRLSPRSALQEMARKILLFALLAAHAALLSAVGEDEVGSGDGSGSGDRCRMSDPLPEPLGGGIVTAGDLEPRCHLACIEKVRAF